MDEGSVASEFSMPSITLLFKQSTEQQKELTKLLEDQQNPASPLFHHWLTPEQYADRFGVSQSDMDALAAWLRSEGLTVTNVARSRSWLLFQGTAEKVSSALGTAIHQYRVDGETHFANRSDPSVPAAFAGVVGGFMGLDDFYPHSHSKRLSPSPNYTYPSGTHGLVPDDIATIYNIMPLYQGGINGNGQKIVVTGQTQIQLSDIQTFRARYGLPVMTPQVMLAKGATDPGIVQSELAEADLDIEWAGAVSRNASIIYVYGRSAFQAALDAIDQNLAPVITESYSGCEAQNISLLANYRTFAQQANAQGITWVNDTGDPGAAGCDANGSSLAQNGLAVDFPGSMPEVTAVGGTEFSEGSGNYWSNTNSSTFSSALTYIPEIAWNSTAALNLLWASAGGVSSYYSKPVWQTGAGVPNDGMRDVPDVALAASFHHDGYFVSTGGSLVCCYGGTSISTPVFAGIVSLLNQAVSPTGLGNINPTLYRLAQSGSNVFHDITAGNNIVPCAAGSPNCTNGTLGYSAGPGYDLVTGLGSVDANNLVHQWNTSVAPASAVVPFISPSPVYQQAPDSNGQSWTYTIRLTEEAGVATTLTGFTIDGQDYTSQIVSFFGSNALPAHGTLQARLGSRNLTVPADWNFVFSGIDGGGKQWTQQLTVPFRGFQTGPAVNGVTNGASFQQEYAPGMIMSVFGTQLGSTTQAAATVPLPTNLGGSRAMVNGVRAPFYYVSPTQINVQIPYETAPGSATLNVVNGGVSVNYTFQVAATAPGIFTGQNNAMVPYSSGKRGDTLILFITGEGAVSPSVTTGTSTPTGTPVTSLPKPQAQTTMTIGGVPAQIVFAGIPSGLVGVTQINFVVPSTAPLGTQPVVVMVGGVASPAANFTVTQ